MNMNMATMYLGWVVLLTAVQWVPYILNEIMVRGLIDAVGYPANPKPLSPWAERAKKAHYNSVENLVIFAPAVVLAQMLGVVNATTGMAAMVYFWARVVHYLVYTFGVPWLRTISFTVNWVCTIVILWQVLF